MTDQQKKIGLAVTALILGSLSFLGSCLLLNVILGPLAIIFGIIALVKAFKRPATHGGPWLAGVGLALGAVSMITIPIVAAIAIPNFINAVNRAKQKRTVADMKVVMMSIEKYAVENSKYPDSGAVYVPVREIQGELDVSGEKFPASDAWEKDLYYWSDAFQEQYILLSMGKDGKMDASTLKEYIDLARTRPVPPAFDRDIVISNGAFLIEPSQR